MKTKVWRLAAVAGAIWRRNGGPKVWMKGKGDEATENYQQMTDDEEITVAIGFPNGPSVWVRCNEATGKLTVTENGDPNKIVYEVVRTVENTHAATLP